VVPVPTPSSGGRSGGPRTDPPTAARPAKNLASPRSTRPIFLGHRHVRLRLSSSLRDPQGARPGSAAHCVAVAAEIRRNLCFSSRMALQSPPPCAHRNESHSSIVADPSGAVQVHLPEGNNPCISSSLSNRELSIEHAKRTVNATVNSSQRLNGCPTMTVPALPERPGVVSLPASWLRPGWPRMGWWGSLRSCNSARVGRVLHYCVSFTTPPPHGLAPGDHRLGYRSRHGAR
jgi:hypothetical protein